MNKYFLSITSALLFGLTACAESHTLPTQDTSQQNELKISLDRNECFGTCPVYHVEISNDGLVEFCGLNFVEFTGAHSRKVDPQDVRALYAMIKDANFHDLRDKYRGMVTDMPTYTVSVTDGGLTKTVVDYAGSMDNMPRIVTEIQDAIDELAGVDEWIGSPSPEPIFDRPECAKTSLN